MSTIPLLLSAYLSKPNNTIYVSKVYYYDKNLLLTQNMPGYLSFSELDFLSNNGLLTVYNTLINYINFINSSEIPTYSPLASLSYGDYFINPDANNFQPTQIIQDSTSSNVNNSKIINFVATVDSEDLNFGTVKPDYTNILTNINNNLASLVSKNNQSEITQKLSDIFEYTLSNNSKVSAIRPTPSAFTTDSDLKLMNPTNLLLKILQTLSNTSMSWSTGASFNTSILQDIRRVLNFYIPADASSPNSIHKVLSSINNKLSETVSSVDVPLLKEIALAISSLASASDNQAIKALKDTISALELKVENNNVLLIDGQQDFCIKDFRELEPNSD